MSLKDRISEAVCDVHSPYCEVMKDSFVEGSTFCGCVKEATDRILAAVEEEKPHRPMTEDEVWNAQVEQEKKGEPKPCVDQYDDTNCADGGHTEILCGINDEICQGKDCPDYDAGDKPCVHMNSDRFSSEEDGSRPCAMGRNTCCGPKCPGYKPTDGEEKPNE